MASVYLHSKFYTNIFIGHRDMTQKYKSKMEAAVILNFINVIYIGPCIAIISLPTKFDANVSICNPRCNQKFKFKLAAAAILNFTKSGILAYSNPYMANIYQCTNFDKSIFICDRDMAKNPNLRWQPPPSWMLTKV